MDKKIPPHKETALNEIVAKCKGSDADTQRHRLLLALRLFPISTHEARKYLDIYYAPARIKELREDGYQIETLYAIEVTESGLPHRLGVYVLKSEPKREGRQ